MPDTWIVTIPLRWRGEAHSREEAVARAAGELVITPVWDLISDAVAEAVAVDVTPPWDAAAMGD